MKYVAVTIDTECDKGPNWYIKYPLQFRGVYEGVSEVLQPLFNRLGVKATYLLSPEVIMDERSVGIFKDIEKEGHELGTHLHGEFIHPKANTLPKFTSELAHEYAPELEYMKLKNLTEIFVEKFGHNPLSYRAGRFSVRKETIGFLESLGYKVDSSLTPFVKTSGGDHTRACIYPYFPSREDIYKPGDSRILEVPITILPRHPFLFNIVRRTPLYNVGIFRRIFNRTLGPIWLRPTYSDVEDIKFLVEKYESIFQGKPIFLTMMFHNVEIIEDSSPYDAKTTLANLEGILEYLRDRGYTFLKLEEIYHVFTTRVR